MKITNATTRDLRAALKRVNDRYDGNLTLLDDDPEHFLIGVSDSAGPGGRLGKMKKDGTRRSIPHRACWHAHGDLFEAIFRVAPAAVITAMGRKITGPDKKHGNWHDSMTKEEGVWHSDLCFCTRGTLVPFRPRGKNRKGLRAYRPEGSMLVPK